MDYWVIIPQEIVQEIELTCCNRTGKFTPQKLLDDLNTFVKNELLELNDSLFSFYEKEIVYLKEDVLKRALNRRSDNGVYIKKNKKLLDLLSYYTFRKNWIDTLAFLAIDEKEVRLREKKRISKKHFENEVNESENLPIKVNENSTIEIPPSTIVHFRSRNFQVINEDFWDQLRIPDENERTNILSRYYTHIDSSLTLKAVANDFIVSPKNVFSVADDDGSTEIKTLSQILDASASQSFSLIKILAEGGVGKSTFLYWISKQYHTIYNIVFIKKLTEGVSQELIFFCKQPSTKVRPFIILFDDAAYKEAANCISDFINEIKDSLSLSNQFIFILAERITRYNTQFVDKILEREFSGNTQTLYYASPDKTIIFERIFSLLEANNPRLFDQDVKEKSKEIFLKKSITSISESTFLLLDDLKLKNKIIYNFDWDDWDNFINNSSQFHHLEYLFVAVACFYQFGIKLRVELWSRHFREADRLMILDAITSFDSNKSPIILDDENNFLLLKHEYVASWFFRKRKNQILAQGFFKDFLNNINNKDSAKLLRKLRKILKFPEFQASFLATELTANKYLEIVNQYLEIETISKEEKEKMLNEKGMILLQLEKTQDAQELFELISKMYPSNNHARDQLARIFLKSDETYQLAFNKYFEILQNGGIYALVKIYKLLSKCQRKGVIIKYDTNANFSGEAIISYAAELNTYNQNDLIRQFIRNGEFAFAENLLNNISSPDSVTAECYNTLGHSVKFSENIDRKAKYFKKAIEIHRTVNEGKNNYLFMIDYAVFLFKIREFGRSSKYIKEVINNAKRLDKSIIRKSYMERIRSISQLFFANLPNQDDERRFTGFLWHQCHNAAQHINLKQQNCNTILQGYLILQTVRYHSRPEHPDIYYNTLIQLAYCHTYHAEHDWNNFSPRENRLIAENYFDQVLDGGGYLNHGDCIDMIKNLLDFKEKDKSEKAFKLIQNILQHKRNREVPPFYRYSGNTKWHLEDYLGAMQDYKSAIKKSQTYVYKNIKDFNNDKAYTLNKMALLICDCFEKKIIIPDFTLDNAVCLCNEAEKFKPDFPALIETRKKIENLNSKNGM